MAKKKVQENNKKSWYENNYKKLFIIPILLFIFSIFTIISTIDKDGTPINRDVSLKGGLSAIIYTQAINSEDFIALLNENYNDNSFQISNIQRDGIIVGFVVDTDLEEEEFISFTESKIGEELIFDENYSSNFISPTLSLSFFKQAVIILIISFILMSSVIFFYFREFVPSGAVVLSALFDIIVTIGVLNFFEVKISIAGIGALLMIIGYSIDTDVLLTNRMFKEKNNDSLYNKLTFSFKTGLLMTLTTLIAGIGAMILTNSDVIFEISLILVVGLLVDFISTWFSNAGILFHWLEKKEK